MSQQDTLATPPARLEDAAFARANREISAGHIHAHSIDFAIECATRSIQFEARTLGADSEYAQGLVRALTVLREALTLRKDH